MTEDNKIYLAKHEEATLADQDEVMIWTKFNVILQAVDELTSEFGHAGDATRQLRVVTQEAVRRDMFGRSVKHREPTNEQLWSWYAVLKALLEGENSEKWEKTEGSERQYREVVLALKARGEEMPKQAIDLEPLDLIGEMTTPG